MKGMKNMKAKRKKTAAAVGIILGVTMLAGAVLASYNTANGYEVGKTAVKKLLENENYTANAELEVILDGESVVKNTLEELYDRNGNNQFNSTTTYSYDNSTWETYVQDGMLIYVDDGVSGIMYDRDYYYRVASFDPFCDADSEDRKQTDKVIRFAELVGDTMVGDLKNNIIYTGGDDTYSAYEISLTSIQIPEYVNAGLSVLFSSLRQSDEFKVMVDEPVVDNATLTFSVDSEGRFTDVLGIAQMTGYDDDGTKHTIEVNGSLKMYDYGTTVPQRVDIDSLENVVYY